MARARTPQEITYRRDLQKVCRELGKPAKWITKSSTQRLEAFVKTGKGETKYIPGKVPQPTKPKRGRPRKPFRPPSPPHLEEEYEDLLDGHPAFSIGALDTLPDALDKLEGLRGYDTMKTRGSLEPWIKAQTARWKEKGGKQAILKVRGGW